MRMVNQINLKDLNQLKRITNCKKYFHFIYSNILFNKLFYKKCFNKTFWKSVDPAGKLRGFATVWKGKNWACRSYRHFEYLFLANGITNERNCTVLLRVLVQRLGKTLGRSRKKVTEGRFQKCLGSFTQKNWERRLGDYSEWFVQKLKPSGSVTLGRLIYMMASTLHIKCISPKYFEVRMTRLVTLLKLNKELYNEMKKMRKPGDPTDSNKVRQLG